MIKIIIYIAISVMFFIISFFLLKYLKFRKLKENIVFYKNQFIINNKAYFDVKSYNLIVTIRKIRFALQKQYGGIIELELDIKSDEYMAKVRDLENSLKILKRIKKYNIEKFTNILNYFDGNNLVKDVIVREVDNAK